jgi:CubicO group peptidase (beta-lactamase class C family)
MAVAVLPTLLTVAAAMQPGAATAPLTPATLTRIERYFDTEVRRADFPGGSLAIVEGNRVSLLSAVGVSDLDAQTPVTPDTVFCIGSLTKSFTATALLQLRDQGLVDLDAPVTRYLPWFRVGDANEQSITLRHLLTHTSGLPTNSHAVVWQDEVSIRNSIDHAVHALKEVNLHHPPGTAFEYANMNYVVLGRVIEQVAGMPWEQYVTEHVLAPAGMTHSALHTSAVDPKVLARPYGPEFGRLAAAPLQVGDFMAPASNLLSTARDMARYAASHLGTGDALLGAQSLREAHLGGADNGLGEHYAFGWLNEQLDGVTVVHHGGAAGHSAAVYLVPERQLAIVVLLGAYGHLMNDQIASGVLALALGHEPPPTQSPSELNVLMWIERSAFGVTLACPSTLAILPLIRRRRRRMWRHRAIVTRALALVAGAVGLWFLAFGFVPRKIPELPLPFGFHGWTTDLVVVTAAVLFTATGWALWGMVPVLLRARSIAKASRRGA